MSQFFLSVSEFFYTGFNLIAAAFSSFRIADVIDIVIISYVLYKAIILFRDTRSKQLIKGIIILLLVWIVASIFNFVIISWAFTKAVDYIILAALIIFQPELRHALERVGYSKFDIFGIGGGSKDDGSDTLESINMICKAVGTMHEQKVGALIVIEKETLLSEIAATGTVVDARISPELICNVFYPKSPLHDGAMIIRNNKVYAAACILPLTSSNSVAKELGTRHRAAIGLSESADAIVVVVSEENGVISVVTNGTITREYNPQSLREELKKQMLQGDGTAEAGNRIKKIVSKMKGKKQTGNADGKEGGSDEKE